MSSYLHSLHQKEKGREVQVAPFKNGSRKFPHATSIYILLAELCLTIPGAGQAGQDSRFFWMARSPDTQGKMAMPRVLVIHFVYKVRQPWKLCSRDKNSM